MFAIVVDSQNQELHWREVPAPVAGQGEIVIDVAATAVNRADLLQRAGKYPPPPGASPIVGLEAAGVVVEKGVGANRYEIGDRVMALLAGGGYAERVAVSESNAMAIPEHWSFRDAAAFPEAFLTAFVNLFIEADLQRKEVVVVHGGASGVGTAAIAMARAAGARVFATASTTQKQYLCLKLGAERAVEGRSSDFAAEILKYTEGVDVILDIAGAGYLDRNIKILNTGGRIVIISLLEGARADLDLALLMKKRARLIGSTLRSRTVEEKAAIVRAFDRRFGSLVNNGGLAPVIDSFLPIQRASEAHERLRQNENLGKVVLTIKAE